MNKGRADQRKAAGTGGQGEGTSDKHKLWPRTLQRDPSVGAKTSQAMTEHKRATNPHSGMSWNKILVLYVRPFQQESRVCTPPSK